MPITTTEAFQKHRISREDGTEVLPRQKIAVAALEAGYCLPSPVIGEAVNHTAYTGQMTAGEFADFCEKNVSSLMTAEDMAKCLVVVAPSGVISRGSLEELIKKTTSKEAVLLDEEVEALFVTLDTDNKGAITAESFMRSLYGDEGVHCLAERRRLEKAEYERRQREAAEAERAKANGASAARGEGNLQAKKKKASACC
ncbi:hypothetical protein JKF63_04466 [Porcisia hertigi]|uniref:EF-hand domain-containing protein n=1 Tax=Porcisia hertigi TaxID=2761500 RepID=A0A836I4R7_9TRYP|nr:hypothetical protein JKF63_04466 [Porcisia hertigi]